MLLQVWDSLPDLFAFHHQQLLKNQHVLHQDQQTFPKGLGFLQRNTSTCIFHN